MESGLIVGMFSLLMLALCAYGSFYARRVKADPASTPEQLKENQWRVRSILLVLAFIVCLLAFTTIKHDW